MEEFLSQLSDTQREAVVNFTGPSLIIAGAGSGKTRVLTYRIAYLLNQGVQPSSILALTFTNKAAKEMKERIAVTVGVAQSKRLRMGTFHSIFAQILRAEADKLGYPSSFTIYDTTDVKSVIKAIVKEKKLDDQIYKPGAVLSRISSAKNNLVTPMAYRSNSGAMSQDAAAKMPMIADIYTAYAQKCYKSGAMDFDDLLLNTNILFRDFPEVLAKYQQLFNFILVDEYQDTNYSQYLIVNKLATHHKNICVVGDDAQSIYSFRGAKIENILNFRNDYPNYKLFKLEQNYRSTQNIVNAANSLIAKNKNQIKKVSYSEKESGDLIKVLRAYTDQEEGLMVAASIHQTILQDQATYQNFAILYRTNAQSRIFEDSLRKKNIPYKVYGGLSFYQRKEIKDLLCYFRLVLNHNDDEAYKRVVNFPARGIGETTMSRVEAAASAKGLSIWEAALNIRSLDSEVKDGAARKLADFAAIIKDLATEIVTSDAYNLALTIATKSGVINDLRMDKSQEGTSKLENLEALLNGIREFVDEMKRAEEPDGEPTLDRFLETVSLLTDADKDKPEDKNKVTIMTIHSAKGLEFKYVYLVGLEDELFPSRMSMNTEQELEEERRLFYVAITRAERRATISYALQRYKWGTPATCRPSRFLKEIDEQFLDMGDSDPDNESNSLLNLSTQNGGFTKNYGGFSNPYQKNVPASPNKITSTEVKTKLPAGATVFNEPIAKQFVECAENDIVEGVQVEHERFGIGKVITAEGDGPNRKVTVFFPAAGQKTLLLKFAKLKIGL
ncbi:ATP-dependent helicase [Williamwhitmania taraxaci]|uniref:DNA 3'-5' helicase n=1 Tax=Williamwhitmania taraxaci TaxID=1640674 RepID=A0A1G6HBM4_9BACT|nr:UvrD-helicase domain-containing protein [Williamwhitmania taraxaci]SDB91544.1 DNA helicase-2 / ATP-dependent DNA helicase PcrA [Williamwhitmania taraxaci]